MPKRELRVNKDGLLFPSFPIDDSEHILNFLFSFVAIVAQLVRALVCGTRGRRFESGLSPHFFQAGISTFDQYLSGGGGLLKSPCDILLSIWSQEKIFTMAKMRC